MMSFFPHDLIGWLTVLSTGGGAIWFIIKYTFVKSFDTLNDTINQLKDNLNSYDTRIDDHEARIRVLEYQENHDDK